MKIRQKRYAWALLALFATISTFPYFAPEAAPLDTQTRIVIMVEEGHNYQGDILRSASEIQKEDPRQEDLISAAYLGFYHSEVVNTQSLQIRETELSSRPVRSLFLCNSCLLI